MHVYKILIKNISEYNAEHQNALDHAQVKKLLITFNNGKNVSERDIKFVCQHASRKTDEQMKAEGEKALEIDRLNLKAAVMIWYHHLQGKGLSAGHSGYSCCVAF